MRYYVRFNYRGMNMNTYNVLFELFIRDLHSTERSKAYRQGGLHRYHHDEDDHVDL